jgi:multidrug efflux system membrane fusion protein
VVPTTAVQTGQNGQYVFVVKPDQTVELRTVEVARAVDTESVIKQGLKQGDTVVTDGQLRLTPGSRVSVKSGPGGKVAP